MLPNHATQTDPYLHEVKGASTATLGQALLANGDGTATFQALPTNGSGSVVKTTTTLNVTMATGTTTIPFDNTIPQATEGTNFLTFSHIPAATGNKIRVQVTLFGAYSVAANVIAALFVGAGANAVAVVSGQTTANNQSIQHTLTYEMTASSTSAIVFTVNVGGSTAGTYTFNGNTGAALFGGVATSSIVVTEIKA
jgi:hypothetical protein